MFDGYIKINNHKKQILNVSSRFRERRFLNFFYPMVQKAAERKSSVRILDIGGTSTFWKDHINYLEKFNIHITAANMEPQKEKVPNVTFIVSDARSLPFDDKYFDIVHSNSTIEHVGRWADMERMANEVRRLSSCYFVQTPNFWFPLEPHFRSPLFHWLPESVRARLLSQMRLGFHPKAKSFQDAMHAVQSSQLIDRRQMKVLFPDAQIHSEKVLFLSKSLMAIKK